MGNICCFKKKLRKKIVLLLVGLDNAGKTVAAKGLAGESIDCVVPTVGFSVVHLKYLNYDIHVYDLGGGPNIRGIWHKYFVDAHGVIFVLDASDEARLGEAKMTLIELVSHDKIAGKPMLFLANKQDNENALDEIDIIEKIELETIVNCYQCPTLVQCCCATDINGKNKADPSIKTGYDWLLKYIDRNYEGLNKRVEGDVMAQELLETRRREETMAKIKNLKQKQEESDEDKIESYSDYARKINGGTENLESKAKIINVASKSSDSSDSFPPVYHGTFTKPIIQNERPKSAKDIVKEQIQLNVKKASKPKINQTMPMNVYGVQLPQSAKLSRKKQTSITRNLKSAGDASRHFKELPNLPNMVPPVHCDFRSDLVEMKEFEKHKYEISELKRTNGIVYASKEFISIVSLE